MGLFDGSGDPSGGLMGMYANPQIAGLLGASQGLLSAAGPSRIPVSMGQAMGAGLGGLQQGYGNAVANQRQMLQLQAMQGLMGGTSQQPQQPQQPDPTMAQGAPVSGGANVAGLSGLSAGMGGMAPQMPPAQAGSSPASTGATIYGKTPQQLFQQGMLMNMAGMQGGGDLMRIAVEHDPTLAMQMPTDISKMGYQGGMTPDQIQAANAAGVAKANYIAPVNARPGAILRDPITMQPMAFNPNIPAGGTPMFDASGNVVGISSIPGAAGVARDMSAAQAGGKAQYNLQQVWDPTANGGSGGFVYQSTANVADSAGGNPNSQVPVGIRNNNFGNIRSSDGKGFATYDTPQGGINAADQLLSTYGSKYGVNTIAGIANRWAPKGDGNNDPVAKAAAMAAASGVGVNDPINLADPATRSRILPALFDTETPGWRGAASGAGAGAAPARSGPMAAQPPLGVTGATNTAQNAPSKQMADTYSALSSGDSSYQASRAALQSMLDITNKNAPGDTVARMLPQEWATRLSDDAAEYEKAHALFTSLQGKSLGAGGTDASRANQGAAVPDFTKPQQARLQGLNAQLQQLDMNHLKTQFLQPVYQQGNEKQFTSQNAAFDQNIKPGMMPALQMSGPQQQAAVQAAIKANPALRPNFEWAFNNGMLK
jgi:hypothetical protein